jgi:hypothetical protein
LYSAGSIYDVRQVSCDRRSLIGMESCVLESLVGMYHFLMIRCVMDICVQQGFLILLPQVFFPYTLSMLLRYPDTKSGGVIVDDALSSRCALLCRTLSSITHWLLRFLGATR